MRKFEAVSIENRKVFTEGGEVFMPVRATKTSAGYDFHATETIRIKPQSTYFMWTDVKVEMPEGEFLMLDVRSSLGVKRDLMLANTIGIGDSDYYNNEGNEGNYGICLRNLKPSMSIRGYAFANIPVYMVGNEETTTLVRSDDEGAELRQIELPIPIVDNLEEANTVVIEKGERIAQGIFVKFQEAENCNSEEERTGGFGSTGGK